MLHKIREVVGYQINIRVDANQKWTYEQADEFGSRVKGLRLEYIEVIRVYSSSLYKNSEICKT